MLMRSRCWIWLLTALSAVTTAALTLAASSCARSLLVTPPPLWGTSALEDALVCLLGTAGAAGALWHAGSGVLALIALRPQTAPRAHAAARALARWGAPAVRRAAAGALASALVLPTSAVAEELPAVPDDLGWSPTSTAPADATASPAPDPAPGPVAAPAAGTTTGPSSGSSDGPGTTYTVVTGDSLWAVTATLLPQAGTAEIASVWPSLYEANATRIGPDPDLIHPGTVLTLPDALSPRS